MTRVFPFDLGPPIGTRANLGLIVLQSDETIEHEFRRLLPASGVALYTSRIASAPEVRRETLGRMEADMPRAAGLLPRPVRFDAVGYACTSGTSVIGAARVGELVREGCATRAVTEPVSALVAACAHLGVARLAFLSPYVAQVSEGIRAVLAERGVETPVFGTFDEAEETRVARIDRASLIAAGSALGADPACEALFLSCTNLRTLESIAQIEETIGKPVLSSNQVLAWHMLGLAGQARAQKGFGRLLEGAAKKKAEH
ncbi:MAG: Asp/Glu racemase [Rhodobacteraceae bacterium]|nr:MAG: Asp/Glu racemase [Paracoccaceae bacterium]